VTVEDFSRADHREIFGAIVELARKHVGVDAVTVANHLGNRLPDCGGLAYLGTLARDTPGADNCEAYARAVRESATLRQLGKLGDRITLAVADSRGRSAAEVLAEVSQRLQALHERSRTGKGLVESRQLVAELLDDLERRRETPRGLKVGLEDFDELTNGLEPGDLCVIAARPSMGKTALLVQIAATVSVTERCAVFSAEMTSAQLMRRCMALQSGVAHGKLRRAERLTDTDWDALAPAGHAIAERLLCVDDSSAPTLAHIRAECIAQKARAGLALVLVDYVQLVIGDGGNRYEQLRDVSYGLKALAKDLAVPILVLAQLNRSVEARQDKHPQISDLRDSGGIEEAADIIGLLYAQGYYDKSFTMPYVLECDVQKNRDGVKGECLWNFDGSHSRVKILESGAAIQYRKLLAAGQRKSSTDL
jgi:replicative DNA helicase